MNTTKFKISARNCWDTIEIGPFNSREAAKACLEIGWGEELIKEFKPLREIMVYYKNGRQCRPNILHLQNQLINK
jgi:hypothetical protein